MAQEYILRLMQQIAAMLATIIAKRSSGQIMEAREELEATCLHSIGLSLDNVKRLSPEALADHLHKSGALSYTRAVMLAELLIQDAEILDRQNESRQALASYLHAFCLLFDSIGVFSAEEQSAYEPKLERLAAKLDHLPSNPYTTQRLLEYRTRRNAA
jgi:hypothetical protein